MSRSSDPFWSTLFSGPLACWPKRVTGLGLGVGLALLLWPAVQMRSDSFVFYLPSAHEVVPIEIIDDAQYLPLLKVLNLVGTVSGLQEKGSSMKVWLGKRQLDLHRDDKTMRVNKTGMKLANPVRVSDGLWMVPLDFVYSALPKLTDQALEYRPGDKRVFIGDVRPATFSLVRSPLPGGTRLAFQFSEGVAVRTAASNGKWILVLSGRPVEPMEPTFRFQDANVSEVQFDDQDGVPKLIITPTSGNLNFYPTLSEQGKLLQTDVMQPTAAAQQPQGPPPTSGQAGTTATAPGTPPAGATPGGLAPATPATPALPAVVLDAGHGGADAGARSRDGVLEKDLVAQFVERLRNVVVATKQYRVVLTRSGDTDPNFDERDTAANGARAVAFLTFHAGNLGTQSPRVMVYTYQSPSPLLAADESSELFVPWVRAQQPHLDRSRQFAGALQQQLARVQGLSTSNPDEAPVRQLRSVNAPAVAIEIGSLAPEMDAGTLASPAFQEQIANAIVQALVAFRGGVS